MEVLKHPLVVAPETACVSFLFSSGTDHQAEKRSNVWWRHLHGEHVQGVSGSSDDLEVVLEDGDGAAQSLVATPTEQGHAHVEEDGGNEGRPGKTAHTSFAALLTACGQKHDVKTLKIKHRNQQKNLQEKRINVVLLGWSLLTGSWNSQWLAVITLAH